MPMSEVFEVANIILEDRVCGNVNRHIIVLEGKQKLPPHEHNFAHGHLVWRGPMRCTLFYKDGRQVVTDYEEGDWFEIPADVGHQLEATTDAGAIGFCLFAVRDEDGGVTYEVTEAHRKDRFWHERKGSGV